MNSLWYDDGLRFTCFKCGRCCTGAPGYVWLTRDDIKTLAEALEIAGSSFLKKYCRSVQGEISLLEHENGDCVFYTPSGCSVYQFRPRQCRAFPFWQHLLRSRSAWESEKKRCPGMGKGRKYSRAQIDALLR